MFNTLNTLAAWYFSMSATVAFLLKIRHEFLTIMIGLSNHFFNSELEIFINILISRSVFIQSVVNLEV